MSQSNKQLALTLAVKTLAHSPSLDRNHGDWVIDLAKQYETYLGEGGPRFRVVLETHGYFSLNTINVVKTVTGADFMDAKQLILQLPQVIKDDLTEEEAIMIKNQFIKTGAQVSVVRGN